MKLSTTYFIISIITILVITGAMGAYTYTQIMNTKTDLTARIGLLESTLNTKLENQKSEITSDQDMKNQELEIRLANQIVATKQQLKEETAASVAGVQSEVKGLQQATQKQISGLGEQLIQFAESTAAQQQEFEDTLSHIRVSNSDFSKILDEVLRATVSIKTGSSIGSGVFIETSGYIVTNYHVIEGADSITVKLSDGRSGPARRVGYEKTSDIALLKVEGGPFERLRWGDSNTLKAGEKVIAVGSPGGLEFSVTEGIISSPLRTSSSGIKYVQTDVPINPGNSGGPLINTNGRIIGINTMKLQDMEGLGFAIHSLVAKEVTDELIVRDNS